MGRARVTFSWTLLLVVWLCAVGGGMAKLVRFSGTPGLSGDAPASWPRSWAMRPASAGITLVVTLHPNCSCSRATLGELAELMTRRENGVHANVVMVGETSDTAAHGELWSTAAAIPDVSVIADPDGKLASDLGAQTSGETYAFDSTGKLLFSGGITPARGHMGDSAGRRALEAILTRQTPTQTTSVVFGCPLTERNP
jgi:hypothetical protein